MTDEKTPEEIKAEKIETEYLDELGKKTERLKKETIDFEAKEAEKKKTEYEANLLKTAQEKWEKDYLEAHPPATKIPTIKPLKVGGDGDPVTGMGKEYFDAFDGKVTPYENFISGQEMEYTDSDSGCEAIISTWSPTETFANIVWQAMYCEANLFRVCVKGLDISAGDGLNITIRTIGKFAAPAAATACECLSCVSATLGEYHLSCLQYGEVTELCSFDIFDAGEIYRREYLKAFGKRWAQFFDATIWAGLVAAAAGTSTDMAAVLDCTPAGLTSSCCSDTSLLNLYNAVNATVAAMREGVAPYDPDYMILSPTVATIFKRMQTPAVQAWAEKVIKIDGDGKLVQFNGLKVIEFCGAQTCSTATDTVFAVIVDSRRAYGAAFGKKPWMEKDRNVECNSWTYAMWCYFAHGALDVAAIAHIKSPNA